MVSAVFYAVVMKGFANWRKVIADCISGCARRTGKEWCIMRGNSSASFFDSLITKAIDALKFTLIAFIDVIFSIYL